ncbi:MAG: hypothetical protein JRF25_10670, partial [Deltaproteobacteria bacterium]|nr:hypothetical protein [Deltaproteobacteria bacterium]
ANVVMLGALIQTGLLDVSAESVIHEIEDNFPESKWDVNREALVKGMAALGG